MTIAHCSRKLMIFFRYPFEVERERSVNGRKHPVPYYYDTRYLQYVSCPIIVLYIPDMVQILSLDTVLFPRYCKSRRYAAERMWFAGSRQSGWVTRDTPWMKK